MKKYNGTIQEANKILVDEVQYFLSQDSEYQKKNLSFLQFLRRQLYELNRGLCRKVIARHQDKGINIGDLIHEAEVALFLNTPRPDNNVSQFSTYAYYCIDDSLLNAFTQKSELRRGYHLPEQQIKKKRLIETIRIELGNQYKRKPTDEEVIEHFNSLFPDDKKKHMTLSEMALVKRAATGTKPIPRSYKNDEDSKEENQRLYSDTEIKRVLIYVNNGILNPREKYVLKSFFGIEEKRKKLVEIAEEFGLTRERIRQIKRTAIRKLQKRILSDKFFKN